MDDREKMIEVIENWIGYYPLSVLDNETYDLADRLFDAGYRLDQYPNGKSKEELIDRIVTLENELDRAKNLIIEVKRVYIDERGGSMIARCSLTDNLTAFLTETSTVKS